MAIAFDEGGVMITASQQSAAKSTKVIAMVLSVIMAGTAIAQIGIGANFSVLFLALFAMATGLAGFYLLGAYNLAGLWCLLYVLGHVGIALVVKTLYGQPVDSYLYAPLDSYLIEAISSFMMLLAIIFSLWTNVGKPIFSRTEDTGALMFLSWSCFLVGASVLLLLRIVAGKGLTSRGSYGAIAFLGSLAYMGIIARTAYLAITSHGRKFLDLTLFFMLVFTTILGILADGKEATAVPWLCFFSTIIFFTRKLPRRYATFLIVSGIFFTLLVAPLIHILRGLQLREASLTKEVDLMEYYLPLLLQPDRFSFFAARAESSNNYYHYFGSPKANVLLPRFTSVQQIDPVIAAADAGDKIDKNLALAAVEANLPKFLAPNKPTDTIADTILVREGYVPIYSKGNYPTLPFSGEMYAIFGWGGITAGVFGVFFIYLLVLKKVGWNLYCNIFSIFLFGSSLYHSNEQSMEDFVGHIIRVFPAYVLIIIGLMHVYHVFVRRALRAQESYARI